MTCILKYLGTEYTNVCYFKRKQKMAWGIDRYMIKPWIMKQKINRIWVLGTPCTIFPTLLYIWKVLLQGVRGKSVCKIVMMPLFAYLCMSLYSWTCIYLCMVYHAHYQSAPFNSLKKYTSYPYSQMIQNKQKRNSFKIPSSFSYY